MDMRRTGGPRAWPRDTEELAAAAANAASNSISKAAGGWSVQAEPRSLAALGAAVNVALSPNTQLLPARRERAFSELSRTMV